MRILFIFFGLCLGFEQVSAQMFIGADPSKEEDIQVGPPASMKKKKKNENTNIEIKNLYSFQYSPTVYNYSFETSSSKVDYSAYSHNAALKGTKSISQSLFASTELAYQSFEFDNLSAGITPNTLSGTSLDLKLTLEASLQKKNKGLQGFFFFSGLQYRKLEVDNNTPVQMTNVKSYSIPLGLSYYYVSGNHLLSSQLSFSPSFQYDETPVKSGLLDSSYLIRLKTTGYFHLKGSQYVVIGYELNYRKADFTESSTRNTTNASLSENLHSLNLGFAVGFP